MSDTTAIYFDAVTLKVGGNKRELVGIGVPYEVETPRENWMLGTRRLVIAAGAMHPRPDAKVFYGHDHVENRLPIGKVASHEHLEAGLDLVAKLSDTPKGNEVYTLARDGVLDKFSVGFNVKAHTIEDADTDSPLLRITDADMFEVSVVPYPQYPEAGIADVLSTTPPPPPTKEKNMPDTTAATTEDIAGLSAALTTLERQIATLGAPAPAGPTTPPFETFGHAIKALATGDTQAEELFAKLVTLNYAGGTIADLGGYVKDSWVGDAFRWVEHNRTVLNKFSRRPLPAEGMGVEYGIAGADTTQVAEQAAEGDLLAYGAITFDTDRAALKTYGGWGDMSVQEIERSPFNVVEKFFRALGRRYSQTTEAAVRTAVLAQGVGVTADLTDADGWTDFLIECAIRFDGQGVAPEEILVGKDMFKSLATMRDGANADAPRFLDRNAGSISVTGLSGVVHTLPVTLVPGFGANDVRVIHSEAICTYEAPGAPYRLTDGDITKLLKAFSLYGYMAVAPEEPNLIIKPTA